MLGPGRVHVQRATATHGSVVIQVGGDLHLSDESLAALWVPREAAPGECPFPGLDAFGAGQARWFFGRERLTGDLVAALDEALRGGSGGPVLVVGPSGAGKSSLLGAGLMAALARGRLPAAGSDGWPRVMVTPGANPLGTLREALGTCARARADASGGGGPAVVVVDQLEEIFTACGDDMRRSEYLDELAGLAAARGHGTDAPAALVVLGLRADFYARATGYPLLRSAMGARQLVLGAMSAAEVRQAITLPARAAGLSLDDGLAERLLRDLGVDEGSGYEPGRLPLLAHALRATWQRRDGDRLTIAGYEVTGGIGGAIARTAEDVYAVLDDPGQRAARQVFLALVRVGEAASDYDGEGTADTRRRVSPDSLYALAPSAVPGVVASFTDARLLTSGGAAVQITHDALLTRWPRLRQWIGEDRSGNLVRQGLEEAAATWEREGRDPSCLYGGARLAAARVWAAAPGLAGVLSRVGRDFLAASDRRQRRGVMRRNMLIAAAASILVVVAGLAGYGLRQRAATADQQRAAESAALAVASAGAMAVHDPGTAMELAVQAERLDPASPQALSALLSTQLVPYEGRLAVPADPDRLLSVAYSPNGALVVTSSANGYVRLWSTRDGRQLGWIEPAHGHAPTDAVAFSSDGRLLAVTKPGGVQLWRTANPAHPALAAVLNAGSTRYSGTAVAFGPGGRTLAVAMSDGTVRLWDMADRSPQGSLETGRLIQSMAFLPGGNTLVTAAANAAVELWDLDRGTRTAVLNAADPGELLSAVAVSPDGRTIAFSEQSPSDTHYGIGLWNITERRTGASITGLTDQVVCLAFSGNGGLLAAGGLSGEVRLFDVAQRNAPLMETLTGQRGPIEQVAFGPGGNTLASVSLDGTAVLWNAKGNFLTENFALSVASSPDGHLIALDSSGLAGDSVALYGMPGGHLDATLPTGGSTVSSVEFSPDGRMLAVGLIGATTPMVQLWDVASRRLIGQFATHQAHTILRVAFSPDGRVLATYGVSDATIRLWSTATMSQVAIPINVDPGSFLRGASSVAFSPDDRLLAVVGVDGSTRVYSLPNGTHSQLYDSGIAESVAFSPDGRTLAIGHFDGTVLLYSTAGHEETGVLSASSDPITSLVFSPDGRTLLATGGDGIVRFWDIAARTLDASITADPSASPGVGLGEVAMAYSRSAGVVVTVMGGFAQEWQTDPGRVAASVCQTLRDPVSQTRWQAFVPEYPYTPVCG